MKTIKYLINSEKGKKALIICAGPSVLDYKEKIDEMCKDENVFTIGINNMTHLFVPDYHLWTNTQR